MRRYRATKKRDARLEVSISRGIEGSSTLLGSRAEETLRLAEAIERLANDHREVIVLRSLEDLPHAEVAQRMGRSEPAVRMLWMRALGAL